jgi:small subunit ribosomal protein S20
VANIKSQLKRIKTNNKAHERNKAVKSALRTATRRVREALDAGDVQRAEELAREAGRKLDKAVSGGVIHKNQAANKKSALDRAVASAK